MKKRQKGFTLVELLIVIGIIAVLMLLGATNWVQQQKKARDARRKADIEQIRSALEMYRSENSLYPLTANWIANIKPLYITEVPVDPKTKANYGYTATGTPVGVSYSISATMETEANPYTQKNP